MRTAEFERTATESKTPDMLDLSFRVTQAQGFPLAPGFQCQEVPALVLGHLRREVLWRQG